MSKADPDNLVFGGEEAGIGVKESARAVVLPVPMELGVSYGGGTGRGPRAILEASEQLEFFDEETHHPYWEPGALHTLGFIEIPDDPVAAVESIAAAAAGPVAAGQFLLTIGGEHTITAGALRGVTTTRGEVGVVVFDAHLDLRDEYDGSRWSHACVMRRVLEEQFPESPAPVRWCGTRAYSEEEARYAAEKHLTIIPAHEISPSDDSWIDACIAELPEHVYLSIDVDGLDPAVMPGTGTPEPGGLSYRQLIALIRRLARERTIVAADIVELAPIPSQHVSEFTAARVAAKLLGSVLAES